MNTFICFVVAVPFLATGLLVQSDVPHSRYPRVTQVCAVVLYSIVALCAYVAYEANQ